MVIQQKLQVQKLSRTDQDKKGEERASKGRGSGGAAWRELSGTHVSRWKGLETGKTLLQCGRQACLIQSSCGPYRAGSILTL